MLYMERRRIYPEAIRSREPSELCRGKWLVARAWPEGLGAGVERGFAGTQTALPTPIQEVVERHCVQKCLCAADRQAHEMAIAAIQPILIVAIARQLRDVIPRALKISFGYNSNENLVHSTATSVVGSHRRYAPWIMHYQ